MACKYFINSVFGKAWEWNSIIQLFIIADKLDLDPVIIVIIVQLSTEDEINACLQHFVACPRLPSVVAGMSIIVIVAA